MSFRIVRPRVIVAIPSATTTVKQKILAASEGCTVPIKTLPNLKQLLGDPVSLQQVRPMSLEDLLQRENRFKFLFDRRCSRRCAWGE